MRYKVYYKHTLIFPASPVTVQEKPVPVQRVSGLSALKPTKAKKMKPSLPRA